MLHTLFRAKILHANSYAGRCNCYTDIKEAVFFGARDQFVVAGSDDGMVYFWDKRTGLLGGAVKGDSGVVWLLPA